MQKMTGFPNLQRVYRLNVEPENQRSFLSVASQVSEKIMMIRYVPLQTWKASLQPQAILLAVMNHIANEIEGYIFYDIDTDECVTDLRFNHHIESVTSLAINNIFAYLSVNTEDLPGLQEKHSLYSCVFHGYFGSISVFQ